MKARIARLVAGLAILAANWWAADRAEAVPCWGGGSGCTVCHYDPCQFMSCGPYGPEPFDQTCCLPYVTPRWTWCRAMNVGTNNEYCDLGELCTC